MKSIIVVTLTLCLFVSMLEAQFRNNYPGCERPRPPPTPSPNSGSGGSPPPPPPPSPAASSPGNKGDSPNPPQNTNSRSGQGNGKGQGAQSVRITNNPTISIQNSYVANNNSEPAKTT